MLRNREKRTGKKDLVIRLLKQNTDGLTVIEIAKALRISRNTVAVALAELKGAQLIRIRPVGMAKLHYWLIDKEKSSSVRIQKDRYGNIRTNRKHNASVKNASSLGVLRKKVPKSGSKDSSPTEVEIRGLD